MIHAGSDNSDNITAVVYVEGDHTTKVYKDTASIKECTSRADADYVAIVIDAVRRAPVLGAEINHFVIGGSVATIDKKQAKRRAKPRSKRFQDSPPRALNERLCDHPTPNYRARQFHADTNQHIGWTIDRFSWALMRHKFAAYHENIGPNAITLLDSDSLRAMSPYEHPVRENLRGAEEKQKT